MYFTYVVRPATAPEVSHVSEPFWNSLMGFNLRYGFSLQFIGYLIIVIGSLLGGNFIQISGCLNGNSEHLKNVPIFVLFIGAFMYTIGTVCIQNFRNAADDDASITQPRGFRAGIKALHQGSLLDILSWSMTTILLFSFMHFFEDGFAKRVGSSSIAIYATTARTLHAFCLLLYAMAFFMLETFHGQGTVEYWGWILAILYKIAALSELLSFIVADTAVAVLADVIFTVSLGLSLFSAFVWSLSYEPLVCNTDVKLSQSAMRNEYYKSSNATAYYGPPSGASLMGEQE